MNSRYPAQVSCAGAKAFSLGPASGIITAPLCPAKLVTFPVNPVIHGARPAFTVAPGMMLPAQIPLLDPTHQATGVGDINAGWRLVVSARGRRLCLRTSNRWSYGHWWECTVIATSEQSNRYHCQKTRDAKRAEVSS
jgi:hypothetical protein